MITPLQSAQLSAEIYACVPGDWDHWWEHDGVICAHRIITGQDTLTFMGSKLAIDFVRDAESWPAWDNELGFCHYGFVDEIDDVLAEVMPHITRPLVIQGHSLGGSRARIAAAKLAYRGKPAARVCVFGSPKPGFANVARVLQKSNTEHASYRNRCDVVPLLPGVLPFWSHTESWLSLDAAPAVSDLEPLRDHSISLYVQGLQVGPVPIGPKLEAGEQQ